MAGEGAGDGERVWFGAGDVDVADDGFVAFVDAEAEAAEAAPVEGDEAGEDAGVEVLEEKLGGGAVVPAEALIPDLGFLLEERAELARGEVAEIEDFELLRGGHEVVLRGRFSVPGGRVQRGGAGEG